MTKEEYTTWLLPYLQDQEIDTAPIEVYPCTCNGDKCKGWKWRFIKQETEVERINRLGEELLETLLQRKP